MEDDFRLQEAGYRKGYYNGYERAMLDLQAMIGEGYHPEQAVLAGLEYVIADLKVWRYGNPEMRVIPPQLNPSVWTPSTT